jgi:membrane protein implicated in regulation of membrane protease activity
LSDRVDANRRADSIAIDSMESVMVSTSQDPTAPSDAEPNDGHERDPATDQRGPAAHFKAAQRRFDELKEYVSYLIAAKIDAYKLMMLNAAVYGALGVIGLLAGAALVVTAVALTCIGVAEGLAALFGGRPWLGNLVTGVLLLGAVATAALVGLKFLSRQSRQRTLKKYAARQQQQRARFGEDVEQAGQNPAD